MARSRIRTTLACSAVLFCHGCGDDGTGAPRDSGMGDAAAVDAGSVDSGRVEDAGGSGCVAVGLDPEVVRFDTDDGVTLEAAYFPTGTVGGPRTQMAARSAFYRASGAFAFSDAVRNAGQPRTYTRLAHG